MRLRANCSLDWFKHTLMVFSRRRTSYSPVEMKALRRIIRADIERLRANNRANSSWLSALAGKAVRTLLSAEVMTIKLFDRFRLYYYDVRLCLFRGNRFQLRPARADGVKFFPVCFTCSKHFRFVRLALLSLNRCAPAVERIYIYVDKSDPFTDDQYEQLRAESRCPLIFGTTQYGMASWGPKVQLSELRAYGEVAKDMSPGDFLVKFDSDVLFLKDSIFQLVAASGAGAVGTAVSKLHDSERSEEYMQGGCYFIGAQELQKTLSITVTKTSLAPTKWGEIPEDQFFSGLLHRCGVEPHYNDFLYFEPIFIASHTERSELKARLKELPANAAVLHFEGNKLDKVDRANMKPTAEYFLGSLPPLTNPYRQFARQ